MTHDDYAQHVEQFLAEMKQVTLTKNADYCAGTDDAMNDYHATAAACDIKPFQCWLVLFMKHVHAVQRFAKTGSVSSEDIHGRFIDIANYAMLGAALTIDVNKKKEADHAQSN